ncbi:MBL fold metallo-hydrolase [Methylocapsa sp. S129]|uniref:MBL fold metallo-hydrolase n=1 Tax=Methylocapsa sp. S129 TaxID=1641869 RepID=UPI00131BF180|nr:MBL fold metallo-hydrolase [Methylocapsa sp. S129]
MTGNRYYSGPISDHFDGMRFFAPGGSADRGLPDVLRWRLREKRAPWPKSFASPFADRPPARVEGGALRVVSIGHASFLIQTRGLNILVDPVFSKRASPLQWIGPARVSPPGVALDDLPGVDAILISHNHYDHLDLASLSALKRRHRARILLPLGNDAILAAHDPALIAEPFDWGARVALSREVAVHFEPAYHWSARGLGDRRMALWCAFAIETPDGAIYCIGDTGFGDGAIFSDIRQKHGAPRLALIPIGAYEPRWFMRDFHVNPAEAVKILELCGARNAIAHHWGTFQLTDEAIEAPPEALRIALAEAGAPANRFHAIRPGEVWQEASA